jgi:hypothetical protein
MTLSAIANSASRIPAFRSGLRKCMWKATEYANKLARIDSKIPTVK